MGRRVIPGIINLEELNTKLVNQDEDFREFCGAIQRNTSFSHTEIQTILLAEGLAIIHERLGNMITLLLSSAGS